MFLDQQTSKSNNNNNNNNNKRQDKECTSTHLHEVRRPAPRAVVQGRRALNEDNLGRAEGGGATSTSVRSQKTASRGITGSRFGRLHLGVVLEGQKGIRYEPGILSYARSTYSPRPSPPRGRAGEAEWHQI